MPTLADIFPSPDLLSSVEPEEVGAALLELWEDVEDSSGDMRTIATFMNQLYGPGRQSDYPAQSDGTVEIIVAEAWNWLWREGLIIPEPGQPGDWFRRTRRGQALRTRAEVAAYRHAGVLPRDLLHPKIDEKAWPLFLRGDYDVAVFQAFKSVEVAVRSAGGLSDGDIGVTLMRNAFSPSNGPLTIASDEGGEKQAISDLFAGAIGHAKNPQSHRDRPIGIQDAARLLLFASYLMEIVELHELLS